MVGRVWCSTVEAIVVVGGQQHDFQGACLKGAAASESLAQATFVWRSLTQR